MAAGSVFHIKPSLLRRTQQVTISAREITVSVGRNSQTMDFSNVREVYAFELPVPIGWSGSLAFVDFQGRCVSTSATTLGSINGAAKREFRRMTAAALRAYAATRPGAEVSVAPSRKSNLKSMSIVAVVMIAVAVHQILQDGRVEPGELFLIPMMLGVVAWVSHRQFSVTRDPPRAKASDIAMEFAARADPIVE